MKVEASHPRMLYNVVNATDSCPSASHIMRLSSLHLYTNSMTLVILQVAVAKIKAPSYLKL